MKAFIISSILLLCNIAVADSNPNGPEPDISAAAIRDLKWPEKGHRASIGAPVEERAYGIHGFDIRGFDVKRWADTRSSLIATIKRELEAYKWIVSTPENSTDQKLEPVALLFRATRQKEEFEMIVTLFPDKDGLVKLAYSQRHRF